LVRGEFKKEEKIEMETEKGCLFYRKSDIPSMGPGIGYCDLGVVWAICDGDIKFCEEPDALIRNLYVEWRKKRAVYVREKTQPGTAL
jgi:hypothetical protein